VELLRVEDDSAAWLETSIYTQYRAVVAMVNIMIGNEAVETPETPLRASRPLLQQPILHAAHSLLQLMFTSCKDNCFTRVLNSRVERGMD